VGFCADPTIFHPDYQACLEKNLGMTLENEGAHSERGE